jgi:hypothetical protein
MTQKNARREEPGISWASAGIPASEEQCWHLLSQPRISGQEQKSEYKNVQLESKQERENPSNKLTLIDRGHLSPLAATDLKSRPSPIVITRVCTPFQTAVASVIPRPDSSTARVTGKSAASTPDCSQSSFNKNSKLYRDVLKRKSTADPTAAVLGSCSGRRYEEPERKHRPTADNEGDRFQQQQQTPEHSNTRISEVMVKY